MVLEIMIVERTNNLKKWESELKKHNGSLFLSHQYLEVLSSPDKKPIYLFFKEKGCIKALISGIERPVGKGNAKKLFFFSGIACKENFPDLLKKCKVKLLDFARNNGYYQVILKSYDYNNHISAKVKEFIPFKRAEFVLDLTIDEEKLVKGFNSDLRRRVRKAKREGLIIKQSNSPDLLEFLFQLLESTHALRISKGYGHYQSISMPFLNLEVMKNLLKKKYAVFSYAKLKGKIISIQFFLTIAGKAYGILMGTSPEGYKLAAPSALFYETTLYFKSKGYVSCNIGAVPLGKANQGIRKFKKDLGATIIESREESTDFLLKPLSKFNLLLRLKRAVNKILIPWKIKKVLLQIIDQIIGGRDKY